MNISMIRYIAGWILNFEAVFLALPCLIGLIYQEQEGFAYLSALLLCLFAGVLFVCRKPKNTVFFAKEGFVSAALCWILMSIFGALPFVFSGDIPNFTDALFETISGFTTTGASILKNVEALSHCSLFWRSFTHWIGGMGVIVFLLIILPLAGGSCIHLLRAESPGPSVGKLVPRMRQTAAILYGIYFFMTVVEIILLLLGGMSLFDAVTLSFGTAGTGGFSDLNSGFMTYSPYIKIVASIFMMLFGVNFNVYFLILNRKFVQALRCEELRYYLLTIAVSTLIIALNILSICGSFGQALQDAFFQVSSIITTTGFASVDFNMWPQTSKTILVLLMFIGACAGSTGGGIKVSRFVILLKSVRKELSFFIHPRSVKKITIEDKPVEHEVVRSTNVFVITYVAVFAFSVLFVSFNGFDFTTNFTAVAATLNNIGPGLELVGPTGNFGFFSPFSKYILMFDMLAGRLELFPMLLFFSPATWIQSGFARKKKRTRKFS